MKITQRYFLAFVFAVTSFGVLVLQQTASAQERLRGVNVTRSVTADDIAVLESWNVNVVRYQLSWHGLVDTVSPEEFMVLLRQELAELDALMPTFRAANIKILLDLHTPPGGFISEDFPAQFRLFADEKFRAAMTTIWQEVATRYKGEKQIFAFDILSEPATGTKGASPIWPVLAASLAKTVLEIDPDRVLVIAPDYCHAQKLFKFGKNLKKALGNAVYKTRVVHNIHLFTPTSYVNQGLGRDVKEVQYPSKNANKKVIAKTLSKLRVTQRKLGATIFIGEFSVVRWAPNAATFLTDFIGLLEKHKWNWTYHIFREADVWSLEHSADKNDTVRSTVETDRAKVVKGFLAKNL